MNIQEKNYDFRARHWQYHKPGMRHSGRTATAQEVMLDAAWQLGCAPDAPQILFDAIRDFQDYLLVSMGLSLTITREPGEKVLWLTIVLPETEPGFTLEAGEGSVTITLGTAKFAFAAIAHLEAMMNLEGAPVLPLGSLVRKPLYRHRMVHSGCGIDEYPDQELAAMIHAGYNCISLMLKGPDRSTMGPINVNDLCDRAGKFGIDVSIYNYIETFLHPDEPGVQGKFDAVYGKLLERYPRIASISLCGESLSFPSKDPHTTGKGWREGMVDGIPDPRPSPGWYPCYDYPAYIQCIERAVHKANPHVEVIFSTYNWGWAPLDVRAQFLANFPKNVTLSACYEIYSKRTLEGLQTPVMDYTISAAEPGFYFTSECETAAKYNIPIQGNVNTAGIAWDFGTVPWVPVPQRWLVRDRFLRKARKEWNVYTHYTTHHYGWWDTPAAEMGIWSAWEGFEPDYDELLRKIAVRDFGEAGAPHAINAWKFWSEAMGHYIASNEDQYGPWRVGPAYPFIFQPNITRTMTSKEIQFPTAPHAHFGWGIIKTLYQPFENENQTPGYLRYPAELRSLEKMLKLWEQGLAEAGQARETAAGERLYALGHFIRNSIRTTMHIKQWWQLNMKMQTSEDAVSALAVLDQIEALAHVEIDNARDTIPAVETDSRIGWEPSMEYVCDTWHLEWKIRQVESALLEIAAYRKTLEFSKRTSYRN